MREIEREDERAIGLKGGGRSRERGEDKDLAFV